MLTWYSSDRRSECFSGLWPEMDPQGLCWRLGKDWDHFWTLYVLMGLSGWELGDGVVIGWSECFVVLETFFLLNIMSIKRFSLIYVMANID